MGPIRGRIEAGAESEITRRDFLERVGGLALGVGALSLGGRFAELARSAPPGIYGQLARTLQGDVVVLSASAPMVNSSKSASWCKTRTS